VAVIVKCDPPRSQGETVEVEARRRKDTTLVVGQRAFVWISETNGGEGLAFCGEIRSVQSVSTGKTRLTVFPDARKRTTPLRTIDLSPHRTSVDGAPIAGLAAKLYFQAHNKIVELSETEEAFLDTCFDNGCAVE
jgi:hypothetical protein